MVYANPNNIFAYMGEAPGGVDAAAAIRSAEISGYRTRVYRPGPYLELDIYPAFRRKKEAGRAARAAATGKAQAAVNERNALRRLDRLVHHNFVGWKDYKLGLDYAVAPSQEEAKKNIAAFFRACRKLYRAHGLELKYIQVTPWATKGGQATKRLHHHVVMNGGVPREAIESLWPHGRIHLEPLQPDKNGFMGLARYLHGHLHGAKRWSGSRNLVAPLPEYPKRQLSKTKACRLALAYELARAEFEKQYPAYVFMDMEARYSDVVDGAYLYVRMRRREDWARAAAKERGESDRKACGRGCIQPRG